MEARAWNTSREMHAMTVENSSNEKVILPEYYLAVFPRTVSISVANRKPSVCAVLQVKVDCDTHLRRFLTIIIIIIIIVIVIIITL
jgi:hypothetical protein